MKSDEYILRPLDHQELDRLSLQHRVWKNETDMVIRCAGFKSSDRLLDLGAGPGFLALDLAHLVGPDGSVVAVDNSRTFHRYLLDQVKVQELTWLHAELADIRTFEVEPASMDGAICRWVLMFVPDVEQVISRVARALRPGAVFAVMEYVQFRSMSLWPGGMSFRRVYKAVHDLIALHGGDADIGGRVPALLDHAGFDVVEILPMLRVGRPGTPMWTWIDAVGCNHGNLVEAGLITGSELESYYREWREQTTNPHAFFTAPPVLATIARRRP